MSTRTASIWLWQHGRVLTALLLLPPLLWLGVVYLGSLGALLAQSFFRLDEFTGQVVREVSLGTYAELLGGQANLDIIGRTVLMAAAVTLRLRRDRLPDRLLCRPLRQPARQGAVLSGRDAAFVVELPRPGLCLEADPRREGIVSWAAARTGMTPLLEALLALPVIGGPSLSISYLGMWLVFTYIWLPYMILPTQAALERVPGSLLEASADLGARPGITFRKVILPLALPGIVAGSIFTFSLTLGDYIVPYIVGTSSLFIGQAVYLHQGTAGNIPLAAAFSVVPIAIMAVYLAVAKRMGAFDAL